MAAQPAHRHDADPDDILRRLPSQHRDEFLSEYHAALEAAHETWRYRQLQDVLRVWHLRAAAFSQPDFRHRAAEAIAGVPDRFIPAEDVIPGWPRPAPA